MSSIGSVTSSSGASYAIQIAQTSSLKRSLNNLGDAIQTGNLSSAGAILTSLVKANPQFDSSSTGTSETTDPINLDFKAISDAIDKNDTQGAQSAFEQLKIDLAKDNIAINDGTEDTTRLLAENKDSINQSILASAFGDASNSTELLLGATGSASSDTSAVDSLVKDWVSYKSGGTSQPSTSSASSGGLNVTA